MSTIVSGIIIPSFVPSFVLLLARSLVKTPLELGSSSIIMSTVALSVFRTSYELKSSDSAYVIRLYSVLRS